MDTGLYVDALTAVLLLLVTGVSSLVHVFSSRYMDGDPRYARYFIAYAASTNAHVPCRWTLGRIRPVVDSPPHVRDVRLAHR